MSTVARFEEEVIRANNVRLTQRLRKLELKAASAAIGMRVVADQLAQHGLVDLADDLRLQADDLERRP
jgi:hypothetical protein